MRIAFRTDIWKSTLPIAWYTSLFLTLSTGNMHATLTSSTFSNYNLTCANYKIHPANTDVEIFSLSKGSKLLNCTLDYLNVSLSNATSRTNIVITVTTSG